MTLATDKKMKTEFALPSREEEITVTPESTSPPSLNLVLTHPKTRSVKGASFKLSTPLCSPHPFPSHFLPINRLATTHPVTECWQPPGTSRSKYFKKSFSLADAQWRELGFVIRHGLS